MKRILLLLFVVLFISGCTNNALPPAEKKAATPVVEKSVSELINEVHDLDTETTFLYNNFDSSYTKFTDSTGSVVGLESLKTTEQNAASSKENGKKALAKFNELLSKINEVKKRNLSPSQKAYIDKLELAATNYIEVITLDNLLIEQKSKIATYSAHNQLFFDNFNNIIASDAKIGILSTKTDWKTIREEFALMNKSVIDAENEVKVMKAQFSFKSLNEYDTFVSLIKEYIEKELVIVVKKEAGKYVPQSEINEANNPGFKAGSLFKPDSEGTLWAEGEKDEWEAYRRDSISSKEDESQQAYNEADAYYQDAKLKYEQLIKE